MAAIHDVFHISQLKKCIKVPTEIIETPAVEIDSDLSYVEQPIQILDTKERVTRRKRVKMYKILWDLNQFPNLIVQSSSASESRDEILFRGEGCDIQVIRDIDSKL
jgi:hypothetical protein